MKTKTVKIFDKEYLLCFSTRVVLACEDRAGSVEAELTKIGEKNGVTEIIWLLYEMLKAGAAYARINDIDNPPLFSYDDMLDGLAIDDYGSIISSILETIKTDTKREVEVKPSKKKTAQK